MNFQKALDGLKLLWSRIPWRRTPIFGALAISRLRDHVEAMREFGISIFFAFLPVLLALFIAWTVKPESGIHDRLERFASEGELMIISVALIAPLCYLLPKTFGALIGRQQAFPHRYAFLLIFVAVLVATCVIYAAKETGSLERIGVGQHSTLVAVSYWITGVSVSVIYLCLVYRNAVEDSVSGYLREEDDAFAQQWREHNE